MVHMIVISNILNQLPKNTRWNFNIHQQTINANCFNNHNFVSNMTRLTLPETRMRHIMCQIPPELNQFRAIRSNMIHIKCIHPSTIPQIILAIMCQIIMCNVWSAMFSIITCHHQHYDMVHSQYLASMI